ncbi:MAG: hypothetical protein N2746_03920 [Deltaproteobacteria bacterium]|nr:hypothetical protein [Deltaproteobacteria bacterium]
MTKKIDHFIDEIFGGQNRVLKLLDSTSFVSVKEKTEQLFAEVAKGNFENDDIYKIEAEIVSELIKGALVSINRYDHKDRKLEIVALVGLKEFIELILKFGNINMIGKKLPLEDKLAELSLLQGRLHRIPRGLKDAALKGFPDVLVDLIDDVLGPFHCYSAGFVYKGELVGNVTIIGKNVVIDIEKEDIINMLLPVFTCVEMIRRSLKNTS